MNHTFEKKHICIISPSLKMGGIERALSTLANYFSSVGHTVTFISCQESEPFYKLNHEISFREFTYKRNSGILGKISFYRNLLDFLHKKVSEGKPDCVLSFGDVFNPLVLLALRKESVPVYISDRTSPDFPFNPIVKFGKKWLYPYATGFIAQTQRAADYKIKQFEHRLNISVIPNAIKSVERHPQIARENQIVYLGRLSKEKGVGRLIEAFSKIKDKQWTLALAGDGPELINLKNLVADLNIQTRVRFLGKVNRIDLLLAKSSIFVLPSFLEGFPNALCEAMSAGLSSVCFDCIPYEELIVNGQNGYVVKNGDIVALAEVLDRLIGNEDLRNTIGTNALQINQKLSVESIGQEFLKFICNN